MSAALLHVHAVFLAEAPNAKRVLLVSGGGAAMVALQIDLYRLGSKSFRVVQRHAPILRHFFRRLEISQLDIV